MEIRVSEYQLPEAIRFNFEELKNEISAKTEVYKNMVYTVNDIKAAKSDRAELNKLKKAINDERIKRQKDYMVPFDAFKKQVDEIIAIINEPIDIIDEQVKAFESKVKEEKEHGIREIFDEVNKYDWLVFDQVFDTKWLNASASYNTIRDEISWKLECIRTCMETLKGLEYEFEAVEMYKKTLSLADAVNENKRLIELYAKKEPEKEPEVPDAPKEWLDLKVYINEYEVDTLTGWLDKQGIEWRI